METRSHLADTFCQFLKLNNDTMKYNKLAKRVTKGASVRFQMCMLTDLSTLFVWMVLFIGTKSRINIGSDLDPNSSTLSECS